MQNSQNIAMVFMQKRKAVTASIINQILSIYNIHITDEALKVLVNTPRLTFNDISKYLYKDQIFTDKLGKVNGKQVAGVYIFTHKETGAKYVGSSIQLATRLNRYLSKTYRVNGKFLPTRRVGKEGIENLVYRLYR